MFTGIIRELYKEDKQPLEKIFSMYWTDDEFRKKLSRRLAQYLDKDSEALDSKFEYLVAEKDGEVVGVISFRKCPEKMKKFTRTSNPAEAYVLAVKYKRKGIGGALFARALEKIKDSGYTETVFYSPESHNDSWVFHDSLGFERVGPAEVDGEAGRIWRMDFNSN